jgi:hypothetical protein
MNKLEQWIKRQDIAISKNDEKKRAYETIFNENRFFDFYKIYNQSKQIIFICMSVISFTFSSVVIAQDLGKTFSDGISGGSSSDNLEIAVHTSTNDTGDISLKKCGYKTERGYVFSANIRGGCPRVVRINVQTMQIVIPN